MLEYSSKNYLSVETHTALCNTRFLISLYCTGQIVPLLWEALKEEPLERNHDII